ncbi:MAG: hypothetical protein LBJ92_04355 [Holosporales bacterium]|nr:hypothetical protein [Holosporales bacterium]
MSLHLAISSFSCCKSQDIQREIEDFVVLNPTFRPGMNVAEAMYNVGILDEKVSSSMPQSSQEVKVIMWGVEAVVGAATSVTTNLSMLHSENSKVFGYVLLGLRLANAVFHGVSHWLRKKELKQKMNWLISCSQSSADAIKTFPDLTLTGEPMTKLLEIALEVLGSADRNQLQGHKRDIYDKISMLKKDIFDEKVLGKAIRYGGRVSSFVVGSVAGVVIASVGQDSQPSYYLTLISSSIDAFFESLFASMDQGNIIQLYVDVSELIYLVELWGQIETEA